MAKKTAVATPDDDDDEDLINGIKLIQKGILEGSTEIVCKGYNMISGENLSWPQNNLSKLEKVRKALSNLDNKKKDPKKKIITVEDEQDTADEELSDEFSGKYKVDPRVLMSGVSERESDIGHQPIFQTQKGGRKFGNDAPILIISDPYDEEEALANAKKAKSIKKTKVYRDRTTVIKEIGNEGSDFHYNPNSKRRPPSAA